MTTHPDPRAAALSRLASDAQALLWLLDAHLTPDAQAVGDGLLAYDVAAATFALKRVQAAAEARLRTAMVNAVGETEP